MGQNIPGLDELDAYLEATERQHQRVADGVDVASSVIADATAKLAKLEDAIMRGATEDVQQLRAVLISARNKIAKQDEMLGRLTGEPLVHAVVLKVGMGPLEHPRVEDFRPGVRVRIRKDSKYVKQTSGLGTVLGSPKPGYVRVKFDSGYKNNYRVGVRDTEDPELVDGVCDLEFVGSTDAPVVVFHEGKTLELEPLEHTPVNPGDTVKLSMATMQIVAVADPVRAGDIAAIRQVFADGSSEVDFQGSTRVVLNGTFPDLESGDRVILDRNGVVVVQNLGKEEERFAFEGDTNVTWKDIGGLATPKEEMVELIEFPFRYPDLYRHYGKQPLKGALLWGPPGCGKTMLGKATASALAAIHGGKRAKSGFIYVKGPEILSHLVSVSEHTIQSLFVRARDHKRRHGYPAVIFIDEADAILGKRGSGVSSDLERTNVPMFLAEMDGLEESGAVVLLATNRPDILDNAVTREGRVDRKIKVTRPTQSEAADIFRIYLGKVPLAKGLTPERVAAVAASELFGKHYRMYEVGLNGGHNGAVLTFVLGNLVSGAMIANVVDKATSIAVRRDIASGKAPSNVTIDDVVQGISHAFAQNRDMNHEDDLAEFVVGVRDDVKYVRKLTNGAVPKEVAS